MSNIIKMISRYTKIVIASFIFLIVADFLLLGLIAKPDSPDESPWKITQEIADDIQRGNDSYAVSDDKIAFMRSRQIWAVLIDSHNLNILWHTPDLPDFVPGQFTAEIIANIRTGYIGDSPAFTGTSEYGLLISGFPGKSYWKLSNPSWEYRFISHIPLLALFFFLGNAAVLSLIYVFSNRRLLQEFTPIASGIQALPGKEPVYVPEKGVLSGLAGDINHTSELLQMQQQQLKKKETARVNWIAGVSHDIRTPLSMVMGYAVQIRDNSSVPSDIHRKASIIVQQSSKMRDLINDLNLESKLEYNMQAFHTERINMMALIRQLSADFMNTDIEGKYPIEFHAENITQPCMIEGDYSLIKRAIINLIQNSINHNTDGCNIYITLERTNRSCILTVEDNGAGISDDALNKLNHNPHYMYCDDNQPDQLHGLGLLIVRQVIENHHGLLQIDHSDYGGFMSRISLPAADDFIFP